MSFNNKRKIVDLHQIKKSKSLLIDDKISAHTEQRTRLSVKRNHC